MKISLIKPYEKNAKKHDKKQVAQIAASIEQFGFNQPIVVDEDNVIIVGHGRYQAAKYLDLKDVPVIKVHLTEEQAKAYRLADNRLNESEWDMKLVLQELKEMSIEMVDLTGFSRDLLTEDDDRDDIVPQDAPAIAKKGDIWALGEHRLIVGDSTQKETYEKLMGGVQADLVFTDPPYNVDYHGKGKNTSKKIMNDNMEASAFLTFLTDAFHQMASATKMGAAWYVFHSNKTQSVFEKALALVGYDINAQLIWNKPSGGMGAGDYRGKHEPFFYAHVRNQKPKFYGDRTHTTVIDFQKSEADLAKWAIKEKRLESQGKTTIWTMKRAPTAEYVHPTQKPVELVTYALFNNTKADDIVLDPFLGSGTTLIACEKTARKCFGVELDPKYADIIIERWQNYTERKAKKLK